MNNDCEMTMCKNKCCTILKTPYKPVIYTDEFYTRPTKITKAGCFIYDIKTKKILLVQSRGKFFGPPKGSLHENEGLLDGASREVLEETGILISKETLLSCSKIVVKNTAYFILSMNEIQVQPQTNIENNDANSIGWIHLDCLKQMVLQKQIEINKHTKILIKKIFQIFFDKFSPSSSSESE